MRWIIALLGIIIVCNHASAGEVWLSDYQHPKNPEFAELNKLYLGGVVSGLIVANAAALQDKGGALFCEPGNLALTVEQAADIMLRFADKHPRSLPPNTPVGMVLLLGLEETFPCKE